MGDDLAYCEQPWATPTSPVHIRRLDGPRKTGGGVRAKAVCGRDIMGGWDLEGEVTREGARRRQGAETGPTCHSCVQLLWPALAEGMGGRRDG